MIQQAGCVLADAQCEALPFKRHESEITRIGRCCKNVVILLEKGFYILLTI
jgi:hypothetical protein